MKNMGMKSLVCSLSCVLAIRSYCTVVGVQVWGQFGGCTPSGTELGNEAQIPASSVAYYFSSDSTGTRYRSTMDGWGLALNRDEEVEITINVAKAENALCYVAWMPRSSLFVGNESVPVNVSWGTLVGNYGLVGKVGTGIGTLRYTVRCVNEYGNFKDYEICREGSSDVWKSMSAMGGVIWMIVGSSQGGDGNAVVGYSGNVVRTACPKKFQVTYAPGPDGEGPVEHDFKTKWRPLALRQAIFERKGWRQCGWLDGNGNRYSLGDLYTEDKDAIFYPEWTDKELYLLVFNAGPYGKGERSEMTMVEDTTVTLRSVPFTRDGYTQHAWVTSDGVNYGLGSKYSVNGNMGFYPYWVKNRTLTYKPGPYGQGGIVVEEVPDGAVTQLREGIFSRDDYVQSGWKTEGGKTYAECETLKVTADETYYPVWRGKLYVVTFDPGQYGAGNQQTREKIHGTALELPDAMFTRTDYVQTGWCEIVEGVVMNYTFGTYTRNAPTTFYPVWTQGYRIRYEPGTDCSGDSWYEIKGKGKDIFLADFKCAFSRPGYRQSGWRTASGTSYKFGTSYQLDKSITLYPVWVEDNHVIKYVPGAYATGATNTQTKSYHLSATLRGSTYRRANYVQLGWRDEKRDTDYELGGSYSLEEDVVLEPTWGLFSEHCYKVSCLPDENSQGTETNLLKGFGMTVQLPRFYFKREGYVQTGWSTKRNSHTPEYPLWEDSYSGNAPLTVFPTWTDVAMAQVVSNLLVSAAGGTYRLDLSGKINKTDAYSFWHSSISDWVHESVSCSYSVYYEAMTIGKWNIPAHTEKVSIQVGSGDHSFDLAGDAKIEISMTVDSNAGSSPRCTHYVVTGPYGELYAVGFIWQPANCRYTVSFGGLIADTIKSRDIGYGESLPQIDSIPKREGYAFLGFYDAESGGKQYYDSNLNCQSLWDKGENACLCARWVPKQYSIRYSDVFGADNANPDNYLAGDSFSFDALPNIAGRVFLKWEPSCIAPIDIGDKTVRAVWREIPVNAVTVIFECGLGAGEMAEQVIPVSHIDRLSSCRFSPPDGKRFAGWACSNGRRYDDGMLVFNLAEPGETVTMTAIWE